MKIKRTHTSSKAKRSRLKSLNRKVYSRKQLENTGKNMFTELIIMLTLILGATSLSKLRKSLNLLLMMREIKQKKHLKLKRSSKEIAVIILKMKKLSLRTQTRSVDCDQHSNSGQYNYY
jgi:hypothetical protein